MMPALSTTLDPHDFAAIARTELLVTDKTTTLRDFTRSVRWNQAYYRLAQGL
ncbi:hypothetical protein QN357_07705 [Cryobacterium sp. RTC2.1]|uniref:hypothetical protein n=1 Tax=Cryobacterium sp. RTC2.1 TaxID=3048634 RepID=UPI002B22DCAA|nr:hypothetical protein [Cryobacterium sp. RTC2.1]MEB0002815.1 hypothetical protein [Cryobacterium sp. RTC2.1]